MQEKRLCTITIYVVFLIGSSTLAVADEVRAPEPAPASVPEPAPAPAPVQHAAPEAVGAPANSLTTSEVQSVRELLQKKSVFAIGFSIGPRLTFQRTKSARSASVVIPGKIDTENADLVDMVLSGVVVAKPFKNLGLGFIAKLDIAQFDVAKVAGPAKSIEGGVGIAWRLHEQFFLGLTFDRVYARSLRKDAEKMNGDLTDSSGNKITSASLGDDRYFVDDYLSGMSLILVFLP